MSSEFDFEPVKGLPEMLPEGEHILWQGSPVWKNLAVRTFHVKKIAMYFVIIMFIQAGSSWGAGASLATTATKASGMLALGVLAIGIFTSIAYLVSRTTVYTITNKRVVMRIGVAISMSINIPYVLIDSASIKLFSDRSGDIPLCLNNKNRMSYIIMFPHVRPWRFARPQPMLRGLNNVESVAMILVEALAQTTAGTIHAPEASGYETADLKSNTSQPQASAA